MSTGADCQIVEKAPGRWYLRVQEYPYGATEDYEERGPFGSERSALDCLYKHFANPGGYSVERYVKPGETDEERVRRELEELGGDPGEIDCPSCGAQYGPCANYPWHWPSEDCRAVRRPA